MDIDSKDETKAIIALGILAGILVYVQIKSSGGGVFPYQAATANSPFYLLFQFLILVEVILFGAYVLFFTLALGMDSFARPEEKREVAIGDYLKAFSDIWFGLGAIVLLPMAVDIQFLFTTEASGASPFNNAATYALVISAFGIIAILAFVFFKAEYLPWDSDG